VLDADIVVPDARPLRGWDFATCDFAEPEVRMFFRRLSRIAGAQEVRRPEGDHEVRSNLGLENPRLLLLS